jgi:hypothetical protein
MIACLVALALQQPPQDDFEELLRQYRTAFEAEQSLSEASLASRESTTASAAARLNTPWARTTLWQTIANESLPPEVRLAAIDALRRMGDVSNLEQMLSSLAQLRKANEGLAARAATVEASLRRHREEPRTALEDLPAEPVHVRTAPMRKETVRAEDKVYKRNLFFGGIAAVLALALLILRKRH